MNKLILTLLVIGATAITGCLETKDEFTINPDGSGKVVHEITVQSMGLDAIGGMMGQAAGEKTTASSKIDEQTMRKIVNQLLAESSGVDTWKDVSYKMTDDGRVYFKGIAYFPDINKLKFQESDMNLTFSKNPLGEIIIELEKQKQPEGTIPEIPEADLDNLVKQTMLQYSQTKPMMQSMLSTSKVETVLHLPGEIKEISNFQKLDNRTARLAIDGAMIMQVIDQMMQDEAWLKEQIRSGKDPLRGGPEDLAMNEKLFGEKAPIRIVLVADDKPLFDYDSEVTAAKANYQNMLKDLGLDITQPTFGLTLPSKPAFGKEAADVEEEMPGSMKVKVAGIRLVRHSDIESGIMPLGQTKGYTLSMIGELPEPAIKATGGIIEKATSKSGESLIPQNQWQRKIKFPKLAKDNKIVLFDIDLLLPEEGATGLEQVSGTLEYLTASGFKDVDLGIIDFKVGAKVDTFQATISSIEADPWQNNATILSLRLNMSAEELNSAEFYSEDGAKLNARLAGYSSIGDTTTFDFSITGQLPPKGRIVLNVFDQLKKNTIPFKIANISLTGVPLRQLGG